jgi:ElaB/YqjD/DUF883 family membrane-anchored ribosome-binding protein
MNRQHPSERVQELADSVTEQAREYGEKMQEAAREIRPFAEKSVTKQPWLTIVGVFAAGFVLGALWAK